MRIGLHVRIGGGYAAAVARAKAIGCDAMQVFSSNPRSYRTTAINVPALEAFAAMRREAGIDPCVTHTPYLINLASQVPNIYEGSMRLLENDLAVAAHGGIRYVNTHLGSYGKRDRMENSAGAGSLAGGTLEELGRFVDTLAHPQLGVCLDTAHAWAAGYQIDTTAGVDRFLYEAAECIGFDRIHMFHFNDTQVPLGGNRDRHWHIGEGNIGIEGFRALLLRPELREKTAILETPGDDADDERNVRTILTIARGA